MGHVHRKVMALVAMMMTSSVLFGGSTYIHTHIQLYEATHTLVIMITLPLNFTAYGPVPGGLQLSLHLSWYSRKLCELLYFI